MKTEPKVCRGCKRLESEWKESKLTSRFCPDCRQSYGRKQRDLRERHRQECFDAKEGESRQVCPHCGSRLGNQIEEISGCPDCGTADMLPDFDPVRLPLNFDE